MATTTASDDVILVMAGEVAPNRGRPLSLVARRKEGRCAEGEGETTVTLHVYDAQPPVVEICVCVCVCVVSVWAWVGVFYCV